MSGPQHPASIDVGGETYLRDAKGALVPLVSVKPVDLLMDEVVRGINGRARVHSDAIRAFKAKTFSDVAELQSLIADHYGASVGGKKGNITLQSFDGCHKVQVQVADLIEFGPELQAAKTLIDECLREWAQGSGAELRAVVDRVFQVGKEGQIDRAGLIALTKTAIDDARWLRAMDAIHDSMRVIGSRQYIRFYERDAPDAAWRAISIDLASV